MNCRKPNPFSAPYELLQSDAPKQGRRPGLSAIACHLITIVVPSYLVTVLTFPSGTRIVERLGMAAIVGLLVVGISVVKCVSAIIVLRSQLWLYVGMTTGVAAMAGVSIGAAWGEVRANRAVAYGFSGTLSVLYCIWTVYCLQRVLPGL